LTWDELYEQVRDYNGAMRYDPLPDIERLGIPGFWVWATLDTQVPYENCVEILAALVDKTGKNYSYFTLVDAVHSTVHIDTRQAVPWWNEPGGGIEWLTKRGFMP